MMNFLLSILQRILIISLVIVIIKIFGRVIGKRAGYRWRKLLWLVFALSLLFPVRMDAFFPGAVLWQIETGIPQNAMMRSLRLPLAWGLALIWFVGALTALRFRSLQYRYIKNNYFQDAYVCNSEETIGLVEEISKEYHIRKKIPVMEQKALRSPMLFGFWHTVLLLPAVSYEKQELEAVIRHELTHFRKKDLWYKLLIALVSDIYWFAPTFLLMKRMAFEDVEFVCDEHAIRNMDADGRKIYGNTILQTMQGANNRAITLSTQFSGTKKNLKARLSNLFTEKKKVWGYGMSLLFLLTAFTGTASLSLQAAKADALKKESFEDSNENPDRKAGADNGQFGKTEDLQIFLAENVTDLHPGMPFKIENCYITNLAAVGIYFYIDKEGTLWGCGSNDCGQLGIGKKTVWRDTQDGSSIFEPQKIAEHVVHVDTSDSSGAFSIFLTESGSLYGMGANMNGLMRLDVSDEFNYVWNPTITTADAPVLLMEDVRYARCGMNSIVALKEDGSVWYWGEIRTTSSGTGELIVGCVHSDPIKVLDHALYVTSGFSTMAAVKTDGTLWTWGNNSFGSCGIRLSEQAILETPVKAAEDVKMVWLDQMRFNSHETRLVMDDKAMCRYAGTTFIEKKDGSFWACGAGVKGEGQITYALPVFGEDVEPQLVSANDTFHPIIVKEKNHHANELLAGCEFGWSKEELLAYLDSIGMDYYEVETEEDGVRKHYYWGFDSCYLFGMNEYEQLAEIQSFYGGSRDGKLAIGMREEEVSEILGEGYLRKENPENADYVEVYYQRQNGHYVLCFYQGRLERIDENAENRHSPY